MYEILQDGRVHTIKELYTCLYDDLAPERNVHAHVTAIRKQLRPIGQDVLCNRPNGETVFRIVLLYPSAARE
jgi:hypothetical protein